MTDSPGASSATMRISSCRSSEIMRAGWRSYSLDHHSVSEAARGADCHEPKLAASALELVREGQKNTAPCGSEGMANGDRPTHHVELGPVHLPHGLVEPGP